MRKPDPVQLSLAQIQIPRTQFSQKVLPQSKEVIKQRNGVPPPPHTHLGEIKMGRDKTEASPNLPFLPASCLVPLLPRKPSAILPTIGAQGSTSSLSCRTTWIRVQLPNLHYSLFHFPVKNDHQLLQASFLLASSTGPSVH